MTRNRFESLDERHISFITDQEMFFVATAAPDGRVNVAPKDSPSLTVMDSNRIVWVNLTGAENETGAHLAKSSRMTLMWCSFTKTPMILRAYGRAELIHPRDNAWDDLIGLFPKRNGSRQILDVRVDFVLKSCGFGVPLYDFTGHRDTLRRWEDQKGEDGVREHWAKFNHTSIDGEPTGLFEG